MATKKVPAPAPATRKHVKLAALKTGETEEGFTKTVGAGRPAEANPLDGICKLAFDNPTKVYAVQPVNSEEEYNKVQRLLARAGKDLKVSFRSEWKKETRKVIFQSYGKQITRTRTPKSA